MTSGITTTTFGIVRQRFNINLTLEIWKSKTHIVSLLCKREISYDSKEPKIRIDQRASW